MHFKVQSNFLLGTSQVVADEVVLAAEVEVALGDDWVRPALGVVDGEAEFTLELEIVR